MPYIDKADRHHIKDFLDDYSYRLEESSHVRLDIKALSDILRNVPSGKVKGAFNYFVSRLFINVFKVYDEDGIGYTSLSDALAVFTDMDAEIRRRIMEPYEDECISRNGDLPEWLL